MIDIYNDIANDVNGNPVYIKDVDRGRKGYFCPTCQNQMVAVRSDKIRSHFRHDPNYVKNISGTCTYSSESYRHKLAKEFIQIHKKIKLPALYKHPPEELLGKPSTLLKSSEWIYADKVHIEMPIYEDTNNSICYGHNRENSPLRPDALFLDANGDIILLIEFIVSNDISEEKYALIRYYGINTIKLYIPKTSPADIEKAILTSSNTQWVYNYEQENTKYKEPHPGESTERISFTAPGREKDSNWKWESCFKFRIRNVVRGIERVMETSEFKQRKGEIDSSIFRIEKSTKELENKLSDHTDTVRNRLQDEFGVLAIQEEKKYRDLEARYLQVAEEHREKESGIEEAIRESKYSSEERARAIESEKRSIKEGANRAAIERDRIARRRLEIGYKLVSTKDHVDQRTREIRKEFEELCSRELNKIREEEREIEESIFRITEIIRGLPGDFATRTEEFRQRFRERGRESARKFDDLRGKLDRFIETRDHEGVQFNNKKRFNDLFEARELFNDLQNEESDKYRIRKAFELFKSGAYKNWIKP